MITNQEIGLYRYNLYCTLLRNTRGPYCALARFPSSFCFRVSDYRSYGTIPLCKERNDNYNQDQQLNPGFITGFTDGDGSFMIIVRKYPKLRLGWRISARFAIVAHKRDLDLLKLIKSYFSSHLEQSLRSGPKGQEVGAIYDHEGGLQYLIDSVKFLTEIIIPHFDKYPLITEKRKDYILWKQVVEMMRDKQHLTTKGLQEIVNIRATLNKGLSDELKTAFPLSKPITRPDFTRNIIDPYWVAGFTNAEGYFGVRLRQTPKGFTVELSFQISQHSRDTDLIHSLIEFFGCGATYVKSDGAAVWYNVYGFSNIWGVIIPFFKKYPIAGVKYQDFSDYCQVAEIMAKKGHLTSEGLNKILKIRSSMNSNRVLNESIEDDFGNDESST